MRNTITVQVGSAGVQIGNQFWEHARVEHGLDRNGNFNGQNEALKMYLETYFEMMDSSDSDGISTYKPRTILIDSYLDWQNVSQKMLMSIPQKCFVTSLAQAAVVFSNGYLPANAGPSIKEMLKKVRLCQERSDYLQTVQVVHSIGGGTGSGTAAAFQQQLQDAEPRQKILNWTVLPHSVHLNNSIESYNAILTLPALLQHSNSTFIIDNEALLKKTKYIESTSELDEFEPLTKLASMCLLNCTAGLRFPCVGAADFRKININLVTFPKLHFLSLNLAPIGSAIFHHNAAAVESLINSLFYKRSMFTHSHSGLYLSGFILIRGKVPLDAVTSSTQRVNRSLLEARLCSTELGKCICEVPPRGTAVSGLLCSNHTGISDAIARLLHQFDYLLKRRQHLHRFDGYELKDFEFAGDCALQLIQNYRFAGKWMSKAAAALAPAGGAFEKY